MGRAFWAAMGGLALVGEAGSGKGGAQQTCIPEEMLCTKLSIICSYLVSFRNPSHGKSGGPPPPRGLHGHVFSPKSEQEFLNEQARKLQDAQAEKLTS